MALRTSQTIVLLSVVMLFLFITLGNIINPPPNLRFAEHVLSMDTVTEKTVVEQRAINGPQAASAAFNLIVAWEAGVTLLSLVGLISCIRHLRGSREAFQNAKAMAFLGLSLAMLLWVGGFLAIGGEWFSMWLSPQWNGQNSAGRMALVTGIALLFIERPEPFFGP